MTERRKLLLFALVVVLTTFPVAIYLIRATHQQSRWRPEHQVYREKISESITSLQNDTPEELVNGLKEEGNYQYPGVRSPDFDPQNQFELVLSSRRTLKLLADLSELPAGEARERAEQISQHMLAEHQGAVERSLDHIENANAPKNTQSVWSAQLAQCCGLFFLARFTDPRRVLDEIVKTEEFSRKCSARISGSNAYPEFFLRCVKRTFEPDNAFKLNVLVYAIERDASIDARDKESLRKQLASLRRREVLLTAWDAATTPYDARHILGAGVDTSKGTTKMTLYEWPWGYESDDAKEKEVINSVAEFIVAHSR